MKPQHCSVGLRFPRSQVRVLRNLADRCKHRELGAAHDLFAKAAEATAHGEPLIVFCIDPAEAQLMADGFTRYGVARPAIEQLSGVN